MGPLSLTKTPINTILNLGGNNPRIAGNDAAATKINSIIEGRSKFYGKRDRWANIGVFFSTQTQLAQFTPGGIHNFERQPNTQGYYGWTAALEDLHMPFKAVPDFLFNSDHPSQVLENLDVLIIPNVLNIESRTVQTTLPSFLKSGGAIVVTGAQSGAYSTKANFFRSHNQPLLSALANRRDLGRGKVILIDENLGMSYYLDQSSRTAKTSIENILTSLRNSGHLKSILTTSLPATTLITPNYSTEENIFFVDAVNKNIDLNTDSMHPSRQGSIEVALPKGLRGRDLVVEVRNSKTDSSRQVSFRRIGTHDLRLLVPRFEYYLSYRISVK